MRVAAVVTGDKFSNLVTDKKALLLWMEDILKESQNQGTDIIVFPALIGTFNNDQKDFLESILELSQEYGEIFICPGSFYEEVNGQTFHTSCIIEKGKVLNKQRQLYLAKWEREAGLARGKTVSLVKVKDFTVGILLSTDVFYPQVSRFLALCGADLILAPVAIKVNGSNFKKGGPFPFQLAGVWQNVQQNLFFAVESSLKLDFSQQVFYGRSAIHGPLEMTEKKDGFLIREGRDEAETKAFITFALDKDSRRVAIDRFNPLAQLNPEFYQNLFQKS